MEIGLFDGHCDTILHIWRTGEYMLHTTGALDLARGGSFSKYCQFFAIFTQGDMVPGKSDFDICREQYEIFRRQMELHRDVVTHCRTAAEAKAANREGKIAAFLSIEGAHSLDCDIEKLRMAYDWGVRAVNITWNNPNALSGTNCHETDRGLSGQGRDFVREMQRLGMLVDVSHLSDPGFWDVLDIAEKPIFASHSNARAVCPHRRNLTDEQFAAVVKNGGVVGLNLCTEFVGGDEDIDSLIGHLEHFLVLGGEKTVALGGDLDGCDTIRGVADVAGWQNFAQRLLQKNYSEQLVWDLFYNNMMRVVSEL